MSRWSAAVVALVILHCGCARSQPEVREEMREEMVRDSVQNNRNSAGRYRDGAVLDSLFKRDSAGLYRDNAGLGWIIDDYARGLAESRQTGRPIFVDYTGYTATTCRMMERWMFNHPDIVPLLRKFVLVRLFTDRPDSVNRRQFAMLRERYNTMVIPFYALVTANDSTLARGTFTRDRDEFTAFLLKGL